MMKDSTFILITEKNQAKYKSEIADLNNRYKRETGEYFTTPYGQEFQPYLICLHKLYGVIGGTKLYSPEQDNDLDKYFIENGFYCEGYWKIGRTFFHLPDDCPLLACEETFDNFCSEFYQKLYQSLIIYGQKKNLTAFLTFNPIDEHEDTKFWGNWPYKFQHFVESRLFGDQMALGLLEVK